MVRSQTRAEREVERYEEYERKREEEDAVQKAEQGRQKRPDQKGVALGRQTGNEVVQDKQEILKKARADQKAVKDRARQRVRALGEGREDDSLATVASETRTLDVEARVRSDAPLATGGPGHDPAQEQPVLEQREGDEAPSSSATHPILQPPSALSILYIHRPSTHRP
jgi:hypothetical protein